MSDIVETLMARFQATEGLDWWCAASADEIERLRQELAEYTVAVQKRDAEIERLRDAIFRHRERVWGEGKVDHPEDVTLYEALGDE